MVIDDLITNLQWLKIIWSDANETGKKDDFLRMLMKMDASVQQINSSISKITPKEEKIINITMPQTILDELNIWRKKRGKSVTKKFCVQKAIVFFADDLHLDNDITTLLRLSPSTRTQFSLTPTMISMVEKTAQRCNCAMSEVISQCIVKLIGFTAAL